MVSIWLSRSVIRVSSGRPGHLPLYFYNFVSLSIGRSVRWLGPARGGLRDRAAICRLRDEGMS